MEESDRRKRVTELNAEIARIREQLAAKETEREALWSEQAAAPSATPPQEKGKTRKVLQSIHVTETVGRKFRLKLATEQLRALPQPFTKAQAMETLQLRSRACDYYLRDLVAAGLLVRERFGVYRVV